MMGIDRAASRAAIRVDGANVIGWAPERVPARASDTCPEERGIFASLTVEENLLLPPVVEAGGMPLEEIYRLFPNLWDRRRQPRARSSPAASSRCSPSARILRTGAELLSRRADRGPGPGDRPADPTLVQSLKTRGLTILLVEQNIRFARTVADRLYVVENGQDPRHDPERRELAQRIAEYSTTYLGL